MLVKMSLKGLPKLPIYKITFGKPKPPPSPSPLYQPPGRGLGVEGGALEMLALLTIHGVEGVLAV